MERSLSKLEKYLGKQKFVDKHEEREEKDYWIKEHYNRQGKNGKM